MRLLQLVLEQKKERNYAETVLLQYRDAIKEESI